MKKLIFILLAGSIFQLLAIGEPCDSNFDCKGEKCAPVIPGSNEKMCQPRLRPSIAITLSNNAGVIIPMKQKFPC